MRKIWSSDHKLKAHNAFANPFVTLTVGILDRTGQKINNIDIKKRKILSNNGSFHPNGDVDRFYLHRKKNRKRIKLVELLLEGSTCFTVRQEINGGISNSRRAGWYLKVGKETTGNSNVADIIDILPKFVTQKHAQRCRKHLKDRCTDKAIYSYFKRKIKKHRKNIRKQ